MQTDYEETLKVLARRIEEADAVLVGAGAGLAASAGFTYEGERFERRFGDFIERYGLTDMYSAGFYPYETERERWAFWSRLIWCNRYEDPPKDTCGKLLRLLADKDYFVITTNVDHLFQKAGTPHDRLFYTQGDYGLWQCSVPCHEKTYDNYEVVRRMVEEQRDLVVPAELCPRCPVCGRPMSMNLRADDTFVEDEGWHAAAGRYQAWLKDHVAEAIVYLELGVGANTPGIIKYPFWRLSAANPDATYVCINRGQALYPRELEGRALAIDADIDLVLGDLLALGGGSE